MRRPSTEQPFTCVTCDAEIASQPVFHLGLPFCCPGCAANGPCNCSYDDWLVGVPPVGSRQDSAFSLE